MGSTVSWLTLITLACVLVVATVTFRVLRSRRALQTMRTQNVAVRTVNLLDGLDVPYQLIAARHGPMLVNPNDEYLGKAIVLYGECCELEIAFLLNLISVRPGIVVEIGANIGTHTVPLAKALAAQGRRLVAFEPQPVIFQNLCANLALNGLSNVLAWPFACGDRPQTVYFSLPNYAAAGNFGGVSMALDRSTQQIAVPCHPLDALMGSETVSLLKIDVEGFELSALKGASGVIASSRPLLYVENDRVEKSRDLIEWLWSKDYQLWWHVPNLFNPDNFFGNSNDRYKSVASFNMLGVPRELGIPVSGLAEVSANSHPLSGSPIETV